MIQVASECPQIGNGPNWVEVLDELYEVRATVYDGDRQRALDSAMDLLRRVEEKIDEQNRTEIQEFRSNYCHQND